MKTSLSEELPILVEELLEAAEVSLKFGEFDEVFLEKKSDGRGFESHELQ